MFKWEMNTFIVWLLLFFNTIAFTAAEGNKDWVTLYSSTSLGNHVQLDFNSGKDKIRFIFDKPKFEGKKEVLVFPAAFPEEVERAGKIIEKRMVGDWSLRSSVQQKIRKNISEIQYLNAKSNKIIHFGKTGRSPANSRKPAFSRSIALFNIRLSSSEQIFQLRALIDENSNIEKYSLVNIDGDMEKYRVTRKGENVALVSKAEGKVLFFFKIEEHSSKMGEVIFYNKLEGLQIEDFSRQHYSLKKENGEWLVLQYSMSEHELVDFTEEVVLTNNSVGHEPVVRVDGSNKFFTSFTYEEIQSLLEDILKIRSDEKIIGIFQQQYHNCMLEKYQVANSIDKSLDQETTMEGCKKVAVLHVEHHNLLGAIKKLLTESGVVGANLQTSLRATHLEFSSCLVKEKILIKSDFHSEIAFSNISSGDQRATFLNQIAGCREAAVAQGHVEEINHGVQKGAVLISERSSAQQDIRTLARRYSEKGYKQCSETVGVRYADFCHDFSDLIRGSALFQTTHFSELKQVEAHKFASCISSIQQAALKNFKSGHSHEKVLKESHIGQVKCAVEALTAKVENEGISDIENFLNRIEFIRKLGIRVSSSLLGEVKTEVLSCLHEKSFESLSLNDLLAKHDQNLEFCRVKGVKDKLPLLYQFVTNIRVGQYSDNREIREYLEGRISRNIKRQIRDLMTVDDINKVIAEDSIFSFAMIISKIVMEDLKTTFNLEVEDNLIYQFNVDSFDALEKKVNILVGNNSGRSMRPAYWNTLRKDFKIKRNGELKFLPMNS